MRPSEVLSKHRETIRQLVLEAGMANPRVFGSVLHGDEQRKRRFANVPFKPDNFHPPIISLLSNPRLNPPFGFE